MTAPTFPISDHRTCNKSSHVTSSTPRTSCPFPNPITLSAPCVGPPVTIGRWRPRCIAPAENDPYRSPPSTRNDIHHRNGTQAPFMDILQYANGLSLQLLRPKLSSSRRCVAGVIALMQGKRTLIESNAAAPPTAALPSPSRGQGRATTTDGRHAANEQTTLPLPGIRRRRAARSWREICQAARHYCSTTG